ncbi:hypothetical protein B0I35DRAFT_420226 [Stachybotrys elegans]|uniref:F-box domain-containing protein n=1 Tax=Stachybotrys elegans TaxID=80388 RepID=A0A8K0T2W5_9HYPO|nr:hypothetical protein B0I35DRAFT_420226 [Stachybotrys elegans]
MSFQLSQTVAARAPSKLPRIFEIFEIFEMILLELDIKTLLTSVRVSARWNGMISASPRLQRALFFLPVNAVGHAERLVFNPLLTDELCDAIRKQLPVHGWDEFFSAIVPARPGRAGGSRRTAWAMEHSAANRAMTYEQASWKRMLLCQPPLQRMERLWLSTQGNFMNLSMAQMLPRPNSWGLEMEQIYTALLEDSANTETGVTFRQLPPEPLEQQTQDVAAPTAFIFEQVYSGE